MNDSSTSRPNVIVIVTDDQGYGDLSCLGDTDVRTPNLDALCESGARFSSFYAGSAVCSPSRAALLSGRYPGNAGVRTILRGHRTATGLPVQVPTLADMLRELGYLTIQVGKWHLGVAEPYRPDQHGFDRWFGFLAGCVDYYSHIYYWGQGNGTNPVHDLWDNGRETYRNGSYLTEMITERAIREIRSASAGGQPFFVYIGYNAPHYPMHAPRSYLDRFPGLPADRRIMAAMLAAVDDGIGSILAELDRIGERNNTMIVFCSDNGPSREARNWLDGTDDPYYGGSSGRFKGHKFSLYEGGIRVPGIVSWPGRIPAGQVIDTACCGIDIAPTVLAATGGDPGDDEIDGLDLLPMLSHGTALPSRDLYWELGGQTAIRRGDWKLVLHGQLVETAQPVDEVFLTDLGTDPGERHNLADVHPEVARDLTAAATQWRDAIEARWEHQWVATALDGSTSHPATTG